MVNNEQPVSFTDRARDWGGFILDPIGRFFANLGISPNVLTFAGLLGNLIGAVFLARGEFLTGGLIILLMGAVDAFDGATARALGQSSDWGAFVDSTTDRWSEAVILLGLQVHFYRQGEELLAIVTLAALVGSFMVSYTRARAEGLGFENKVGILTRMERYLILAPSIVLGIPQVAVWIIAVLANFTAVQRIWNVKNQWYAAQAAAEKEN